MARMRIPPRRRVRLDTAPQRSLIGQLEQLVHQSNRGFVETRKRSFYKYRSFLLFVAGRFEVGDIRLIEPRHVAAFAAEEFGRGKRPGTVLSELSAIRFWHGQVVGRKYDVPGNRELLEGDLSEKTQRRFRRL